MILPNISLWNAGTQHDQEAFNAVSDALDFLLNPPHCKVSQTSAQAIASGATTATAITFDTADIDNDGMWSAGTPTYITIQTPGWYEVEYAVCWATSASTTYRTQALYLNGNLGIADSVGYTEYTNTGGATPQIWQAYDAYFNTGDHLSLGVMQGTGASLNTASSGTLKDQQTFLRVRWASL